MARITIDQLVYISRSHLEPEALAEGLADITKVAALFNGYNDITGALALVDGYFVQLLEGAPAALDILLLHLHFDSRHSEIEIVARERVPHRAIPDWGMISAQPHAQMPTRLSELLRERPSQLAPWREALLSTIAA